MSTSNLRKKLIVIDGNLNEVKRGTKLLLKSAEDFFKGIDKLAASSRGTVSGLSGDVKDSGCVSTLNGVAAGKLGVDDYDKTAYKIEKNVNDLMRNIHEVDQTWKKQAGKTRDDIKLLSALAKEYLGLIGKGGVNIGNPLFIKNMNDFIKRTAATRAQILINLVKRFEELEGIREEVEYSVDPVNLCTGNFIYNKEDIVIPGAFPLAFKRFYNAIDVKTGPMGKNWRHPFEITCEAEDNGDVSIYFDDGHLEYYALVGDRYESPIGKYSTLTKDGDNFILTRKDKTKYTFNDDGNLISIEDTNENKTKLAYTTEGYIQRVSNACGSFTFEHDDNGFITKLTDNAGREVKYEYTGVLLTKVTNPLGRTLKYKYDGSDRLQATVNAMGKTTVTNEFDGEFRTTKQKFFDNGVMAYAYDEDGMKTTLTEQNGNVVTYEHDDRYRITAKAYSDGREEMKYDNSDRRVSFKDKNGNEYKYGYDGFGNMTKVVDPLGNEIKFIYDENSKLIQVETPYGTTLAQEYDSQGNLIKGFGGLTQEVNEFGCPTKVVMPDGCVNKLKYDAKGNVIRVEDSEGITQYFYDDLNRAVRVINSNGNELSFEYNTNNDVTRIVSKDEQEIRYEYNANNKLNKIIDADGSVTEYTYNDFNRLTSFKNSAGEETRCFYDKMWNVTRVVFQNGNQIKYEYNLLNRLEKIIDVNGHETKYEYDCLGNIVSTVENSVI